MYNWPNIRYLIGLSNNLEHWTEQYFFSIAAKVSNHFILELLRKCWWSLTCSAVSPPGQQGARVWWGWGAPACCCPGWGRGGGADSGPCTPAAHLLHPAAPVGSRPPSPRASQSERSCAGRTSRTWLQLTDERERENLRQKERESYSSIWGKAKQADVSQGLPVTNLFPTLLVSQKRRYRKCIMHQKRSMHK